MNKCLALPLAFAFALSVAASSFAQSANGSQAAPVNVVSQPVPPAVVGRAVKKHAAAPAAAAVSSKAPLKKAKHAKKSKKPNKKANKHAGKKATAAQHAKLKARAGHKLHS